MISKIDWQGTEAYVLENDYLTVTVCPGLNNNLFSIVDKTNGRELLRQPSGPDALKNEPIQYGTPILMPPNRIRKGQFSYNGKEYRFDVNHATGNHIHGMLRNYPWDVTGTSDSSGRTSITCAIDLTAFPDVQRQYPHELTLEVTYALEGTSIVHQVKATNRGAEPAPFGYGLHTWFLLDGEPENWSLKVPVSEIWELDEANIPTGDLVPLGSYEKLLEGDNLQGHNMDTVFQIGDNPCLAELSKGGLTLRYSGSAEFKQWVIYTKGEARDFICLEPYTWVTNAPNIDRPAAVTGVRAVEAGQPLELTVTLDVVHG